MGAADFFIGPIKRLVIYQLKKDCKMTKILTMPAMATEGTTVCYTVTHDDLIDFAREIIERTKEMDEAEKAETSASVVDGYYTRKEELIEDLNSDVSQKKNRCRYLDLQISNRDAVLQQRQKQADGLPSLGFPPEKGPLGYNTKEEEQYFASAVAKDRLRVASAIKVDDEPTRKQMWDVIQEYRPKVKEYDKLKWHKNCPGRMKISGFDSFRATISLYIKVIHLDSFDVLTLRRSPNHFMVIFISASSSSS